MAAPSDAGRDPFGMGTTDDGTRVDDGYLSDLLSFSVTQLNREPERLKEQGERAVIARRETAQRRYDAFVGASECYDVVRREVADVERGLEAMRASLPALRAGCQAFAQRAEQISKARAAHRRTLANQTALLDLLEAPSLQDTCVRHGNYDEALEIQSFVDKATRRHGEKKIATLKQIAEGSRNASDAMLSSLLDKLRDPHIALPECLKVVGVLRRSDAMDETVFTPRVSALPRKRRRRRRGGGGGRRRVRVRQAAHGRAQDERLRRRDAVPRHLRGGRGGRRVTRRGTDGRPRRVRARKAA
jgi:hypothetical protein